MTGLVRRLLGRVAMVALGLVVGTALASYSHRTAPVVITGMHEADGIALRGGMIDLVMTTDRSRFCPSETQRYLWRWTEIEGEQTRQFVPLVQTAAPPGSGSGRVMLSIPVPLPVAPGEWFYRAITIERCSWLPAPLRPYVWRTPDVAVRIGNPPAN